MPRPCSLRTVVITAAGLLCAASLSAQAPVWKVTKGASTLYIGGTCHILRPADFPLPKEFDSAYAASSALYFETDLARMTDPATQQLLFARGIYKDGDGSLAQALDAEAWQAVQGYCAKSGLPVAQVQQFRPWLFTVMIAIVEFQKIGVTQEGVDLHYFKRGRADRKTLGGLEDFEQHLNYITTMGAGHESDLVKNTVEELEGLPAIFNALIAAWKSGDLAKTDELMFREIRDKYPAIYQQLIVDRNRLWVPKIEELANTPETEFVLVGFGHLSGEAGLITALKQRGYEVEPLVVKN